MQFPLYLHLGSLRIHPHWIFESLAYFIGFRLYLYMRRHQADPVSDEVRWSVITAAALGAAAGSRLLAILEQPTLLAAHWQDPLLWLQGKTIVGALIGGWIAVEICKKRLGVQQRTGDLFALPLCVGIAVGRIGCFLTGPEDHTFGRASSVPWAMDFGDSIRRHPLPLYEMLFLLGLSILLVYLLRRPHKNGDLFKMFLSAYMGWRFCIDFLKDRDPLFLNVTAIQWACLVVVVYYLPDIRRWFSPRYVRTELAPEAHGD